MSAVPDDFDKTWVGMIKRKPYKSIAIGIALLSSIPGAIGGATYLIAATDGWRLATHGWVEEWGRPMVNSINSQGVSVDRLLFYQTEQLLEKAKADVKAAPSTSAMDRVTELQGQLDDIKARICKATGKTRDCR